ERCIRALETGRQLWPVAQQIEYRLALEAPAAIAASMLEESAGRFALGPLAEVAASSHSWEELAPHAPPTIVASLCAHERVVRGEDLRGFALPGPDPLELPLCLEPWEPDYPVVTYRSHSVEVSSPLVPRFAARELAFNGAMVRSDVACAALEDLVRAWSTDSQAEVRAVAVEGDAFDAIGAIAPGDVQVAASSRSEALAWMAFAAGSGGTHGRRRGLATGRLDAWLALASLGGAGDEGLDGAAIAQATEHLEWVVFHPVHVSGGWGLHLAVSDPDGGIAHAVAAHDPA
ncbi:MAG TPA: hypothetical protein VIC35_12135, partial [Acidimicrobiia bacterium]